MNRKSNFSIATYLPPYHRGKLKKQIKKIRLILYQALPIDLGLHQNLTREGCKQKFNKKQLDGECKLRADYLIYLDGQAIKYFSKIEFGLLHIPIIDRV